MGIIRFVLVLFVVSIGLSTAALVWPRVSKKERPEFLEKVYQAVGGTTIGRQASLVLGVDTTEVEPFSPQGVTEAIKTSFTGKVTQYVEQIILIQAVRQISNFHDALDSNQKSVLRGLVCEVTPTPLELP